jgi:D-alanyl-D-alanine carboxypeptidase
MSIRGAAVGLRDHRCAVRHRRRSLAALPLAVVGVCVVAAFGGTSPVPLVQVDGVFVTVPVAPSEASFVAAPTTAAASDVTVPDRRPPVTALGRAVLPGVDWKAFDDAVAERLLARGDQAVSIAVAKDGYLVHNVAYGVANPLFGVPVEAGDRFRIASNSKVLTSATALQLVDDGLLTLDEPVLGPLAVQLGAVFGDQRMSDVTLRQLLGHTSGFADFTPEFFRGGAVGCEDAAIAALRGRLSASPGRNVNYSNMNFCITGLLIELATGDAYESAVYDRLLTPLGITGMRVTGNDDVRAGEVVHQGNPSRNFMEVLGGAGSWLGSASDLVRIVDSLDVTRPGWHPISVEMAAEMQGRSEQAEPSRSFGLGLGLRLWGDEWGHTGTLENAHSMVLHRPDGITWAIVVSGGVPDETDDLRSYADRGFASIGGPLLAFVTPEPLDEDRRTIDDRGATPTTM